tara:strand:+ start:1103 stop:1465 length:363 start_codon:yes stop_codon:yes gene_type:complete
VGDEGKIMKENSFSMTPVIVRNKPKKKDKVDVGGAAMGGVSGAMSGAAAGSPFGPPGQIIGATLGGLYGIYKGAQGGASASDLAQSSKDFEAARSKAAQDKLAELGKKLKPVVKAAKKSA